METNIKMVRPLGFSLDQYEVLIQGEWKPLEAKASEKVLRVYEALKDNEEITALFVNDEKKGNLEILF